MDEIRDQISRLEAAETVQRADQELRVLFVRYEQREAASAFVRKSDAEDTVLNNWLHTLRDRERELSALASHPTDAWMHMYALRSLRRTLHRKLHLLTLLHFFVPLSLICSAFILIIILCPPCAPLFC